MQKLLHKAQKACLVIISAILISCLIANVATARPFGSEYHRRVVETILDTEARNVSDEVITTTSSDVDNYLVNTGIKSVSYAITHKPEEDPPRGVYKITVGPHRWVDMRARWWKPVKVKSKKFSKAQFWSRPVTANSRRFVEVLVREKRDPIGLELRLVFESKSKAISTLLKEFELFVSNAEKNGLFDESKFNTPVRAPVQPAATLAPVVNLDYSGTWKGPMRNSKGANVPEAQLEIKVQADGKVTGSWFKDWKLLNGNRNGNIITWEHRRVGDGCRDYINKMVVDASGNSALLTYHVLDRCAEPKNYSGTHRLSR